MGGGGQYAYKISFAICIRRPTNTSKIVNDHIRIVLTNHRLQHLHEIRKFEVHILQPESSVYGINCGFDKHKW